MSLFSVNLLSFLSLQPCHYIPSLHITYKFLSNSASNTVNQLLLPESGDLFLLPLFGNKLRNFVIFYS